MYTWPFRKKNSTENKIRTNRILLSSPFFQYVHACTYTFLIVVISTSLQLSCCLISTMSVQSVQLVFFWPLTFW